MSSLAEAYIHLRADARKLPSDLAKLKSTVTGSISSLAGTIKKTLGGALGVGLSTAGVLAALGKSMQLAKQQIDAEKKLGAVLEATGHAAGFHVEELKEQAAALQRVTNYGDETTLSMMAVLATFRNIRGDVFKQATASILDMSSVLGTDLKGSAIQVGKALNDPIQGISALTRVGITFTDAQKEQVKALQESGDMVGAQRVILAELEAQFGGAAKAMADPMVQLKNSLGDLGEAIGMQLLPFARMLAEDLTKPTEEAGAAAARSATEFGGLAAVIIEAVGYVQTLALWWKKAQVALAEFIALNIKYSGVLQIVAPEFSAASVETYRDEVAALEKEIKAIESRDWAADVRRRYRDVMRGLQAPTPGGPLSVEAPGETGPVETETDPKKLAERFAVFEVGIRPAEQFRKSIEAVNQAIAEQGDEWERTRSISQLGALREMEQRKADTIRAMFVEAFGGAKTPVQELTDSLADLREALGALGDDIPADALAAALTGRFDAALGAVEKTPAEQSREAVEAFNIARDELTFGVGLDLPVEDVNRLLADLEKRLDAQLGITATEDQYKTIDQRHAEQVAHLELQRQHGLDPAVYEQERQRLDAEREREHLELDSKTADTRAGGFMAFADLNRTIQESMLESESDRIQRDLLALAQEEAKRQADWQRDGMPVKLKNQIQGVAAP
ncbi:MAG: phage tail length tape measure family protein [Thermoguttaceae bacterium]|jgi:phage-related minor tail protein|nr:phage tail length tape measure family protein [Thermoguttaceae bacterium]